MPRLEDLRKNLHKMSEDELREKVREIRKDRRITKQNPKAKVAKVKRETKAVATAASLMASLSPEDRAELMKSLEGSL